MIIWMAIGTVGLVAVIITVTARQNRKAEEVEEEAQQAIQEMQELKQKVNRTIDQTVNLSHVEIHVLDYYDRCNIKIPSDIIEDLHHMELDDEEDVFNFIESQRNYWKLENTKKVFRKGR